MRAVAIGLALATLAAGIHWGSTVAGGADSYGYISEAGLWRRGQLTIDEPIVGRSPWPLAADTWAPLGYRAAPNRPGAIVPLYPSGFPLIVAAFQAVGGFCAAFLVVPLCGALTVWLTYALGRRVFARAPVALGGALLVATSPVFVYQLMNPMSDVPATAAWTLALLLAVSDATLSAGLVASAALLIRPNLVGLTLPLAAWLLVSRTESRGRVVRFAAGLVPGIVAVAATNAAIYESPWTSGYGTSADLYAVSNAWTNVRQFALWILGTQTPLFFIFAVPLTSSVFWRGSRIRYPRLLLGGFVAVVGLSYLFYIPFDAWWYLRFLLPAWPVAMLLLAHEIDWDARAMIGPRRADVVTLVASIALAVVGLRVAVARQALDVGRLERGYIDVARFVSGHTDESAVMLAVQHSGTLRMYAGRLTLRFDELDPAWLDRVVAFLESIGRHPYFVLQGTEQDAFRNRFGAMSALGGLNWRPFATMPDGNVAIYDPLNRSTDSSPLAIGAVASRHVGWRCDRPSVWPPPTRLE